MKVTLLNKLFILFLMLAANMNGYVCAQEVKHKMYPKAFKASSPDKILLKENNTVYFLTTEVSGTTGGESMILNSASMDGTVKSEKIKLPKAAEGAKDKDAKLYSFNNKIIAFVEGVNKKEGTRDFYAVEFDKTTLSAKPTVKKLVSAEKSSNGLFNGQSYSCIFSPDSKKLAVILKTSNKSEITVLRCFLFDEAFNNIETFDLDKNLANAFFTSLYTPGSDYLLSAYGIYNSTITEDISRLYLTNQGELVLAMGGSGSDNSRIGIIGKDKPVQYVNLNLPKGQSGSIFCQRTGNAVFVKSNLLDNEGKPAGMYLAKFNLDTKKVEFEHSEKYSSDFLNEYKDKDVYITQGIDKTTTLGIVHSETGRTYVFDQSIWTDRLSSDNSINYHTGNLIISCIDKSGSLVYRETLLKLGHSSMFDRLAFIPVVDGDKLYVLFQDQESNLATWKSGEIKAPGLRKDAILSVAAFDPSGKQTRANTNIYDQKSRLFIRTDHSTFVNHKKALIMLFNRNKEEGTFVEVELK